MPRIPPELCARCKGYKKLCGLPTCPILDRFRSQIHAANKIRDSVIEGESPPSILVGERGYPRVRVYYLIPPGYRGEEARYHEAPVEWTLRREPLQGIIRLRSELVSAYKRVEVNDPWKLYEDEISISAISERPVDSEAHLARPPSPRLSFNGLTKPLGPSAPVMKLRISSNPAIPRVIERAIWDDAKTTTSLIDLYTRGIDVYTLQKMLSAGLLGRIRRRRVVPTRWAITAVDDTISKYLRERIRDFKEASDVKVYYSEYLGNRFLIILMPGHGSVEWIEAWHPFTVWTRGARRVLYWRIYEDPLGRANGMDGGFSAARISVLEHLARSRVKGDVVIIREILPSYYAPVGNWHIRESVKRALSLPPIAVNPTLQELQSIIESKTSLRMNQLSNYVTLIGLGKKRISRITEFIE
ncbi:MAG: Nre family DNA repair protein [Desulfurococcales archaeon]|nr:Nre family DNA repair protein [Desulfurococcales archaeon]